MQKTISLSLPEQSVSCLNKLSKKTTINKSRLVRNMISELADEHNINPGETEDDTETYLQQLESILEEYLTEEHKLRKQATVGMSEELSNRSRRVYTAIKGIRVILEDKRK